MEYSLIWSIDDTRFHFDAASKYYRLRRPTPYSAPAVHPVSIYYIYMATTWAVFAYSHRQTNHPNVPQFHGFKLKLIFRPNSAVDDLVDMSKLMNVSCISCQRKSRGHNGATGTRTGQYYYTSPVLRPLERPLRSSILVNICVRAYIFKFQRWEYLKSTHNGTSIGSLMALLK